MVFKEHQLRLYLDRRLSMAFTKLRADKELGRSFAGLLCFVEGLHNLGFLGDQDYDRYRKRYSTPLDQNPEQVSLTDFNRANEVKEMRKMFGQVIAQFQLHKDKEGWVDLWREKASKNAEIPEARELLAIIEEYRSR